MLQRVLGPLADRWAWVGTALRVQERFAEMHGNSLAGAVTLTAFISLFPLLLAVVAVVGFVSSATGTFADDVVEQLGLTGEAAATFTDAITTAEESRRAASVVGLAGLLWSGLGLVAAMQLAINSVWQVPSLGLRGRMVGLAWLAGAAVIFVGSVGVTTALNVLPGLAAPGALAVALGVNLALWLWSMRVLPNRSLPWKALLPGAVLGAVGLEVLKVVGAVWVPRMVATTSALYGTLGVVFAVLAWLLLFGRLFVYASVLNVVRWEEDHGTVTAQIELPRVPGEAPVEANRAGEGAVSR